MSEFLNGRGKGVSVRTNINPAQSNLNVVVLQSGMIRGQAIASVPELQAYGYAGITQQVYNLM